MAVTIGELLVNLRASTASFAKDLDKVQQLSFDSAKAIERSWSVIGTAVGAAVSAAAGAMIAGIQKTAEWEVQIGHLAQSAGVTTETMSGLAFTAKMMGIEVDQVAQALERFDKQMISAQLGNKKASQNMSLLGIDPAQIKTSDDALMLLAEHFSKMPDGALKSGEAMQAFGKAGAAMIPILNLGRQGIQDFLDEAKAMGVVISKDQAEAAEVFEQNITRMKEALHGLLVEITNAVLPALNDLSAEFQNTSKQEGFWQAFAKGVEAINEGGAGIARYAIAGDLLVTAQEKQRKAVQATTLAVGDGGKAIETFEKSITKSIETVRESIATFGQSAIQIEIYKLKAEAAAVGDSAWASSKIDLLVQMQKEKALLDELAALDTSSQASQKLRFAADQLKADQDDLAVLKAMADEVMVMANLPNPLQLSPGLSKDFTDANNELTTSLQHSIAVWGMSAHDVTLYNLALLDSSPLARAVAKDTAAMVDKLQHIQDVTTAWKEFGQVADSALNDLIFSGKKFTDVLKDIVKSLGEMFLKWSLFGISGHGGLFAALGAAIGIGGLAAGGPIGSGQPAIVGESGPELFIPAMSGMIVPNHAIGGGGINITYQVDARGSSLTQEQIVRAMKVTEDRAVARAVSTAREIQQRT